MENIQDSLMPPPGWNPYSRAAWTELQLQFRPPRDGPSVGTRLRHYATAEEIDVALAALQQVRRDLSLRKEANRAAEKRTIKEAARPQPLSPATADFRFRCHRKPAGDVGMPSAGRDVSRRRDGGRTQRAAGLLQRAVRMPDGSYRPHGPEPDRQGARTCPPARACS